MQTITSKYISAVVQGAIDKEKTPKCLKSIRKYLPDAEIILSTWEGADTSGLEYDKLVLNKDPGSNYARPVTDKPNNTNRQIVSTIGGCREAERKYMLKFRTDCILKNADFIKIYEKFNSLNIERDKEYSYFKQCVLIDSYFTRNVYDSDANFAYHPSDIWMFGLREDIQDIFDIPLQTKFIHNEGSLKYFYKCPEQHIFLSYLQKKGYFCDLKFFSENNYFIQQESTKLLLNNFYIINHKKSGILFPKHLEKLGSRFWVLTTSKYFGLFKQFYSKTYKLPIMFKYDDTLETLKIKKYCFQIKNYLQPLINIFKIPYLMLKILIQLLLNFYKLFIRNRL